jgi:integrase
MSDLKKHKDRKGNSTAHLYQDQNTLEFWAVIRVKDKVRKKNLQTSNYLEAISKLPSVLIELGKPVDEKTKSKLPAKIIKDYWLDLRKEKVAREYRPGTLKAFDTNGRVFILPYFGNMRPDEIHSNMLTDYLIWHRTNHQGKQLFNIYKYLRNVLKFMLKVGAIQQTQMPEFILPKKEKQHHDKKKGRVLTPTERKALAKPGSIRIKLIVGLGDDLGMRKMEIGCLEKERLKKEDGRTFIHLSEDDTKTGMARVVPIPRRLEKLLEKQIELSGDSQFLFPRPDGKKHVSDRSIDIEWNKVKAEAKIQGRLRFHDLRHSRATEFARANINPAIACTILGMSLRMYQKVYLNLSGKDLAKAIDSMEARK